MFFWSNMESELFTRDTPKDNYSSGDSHSPGYNPCYPSYLEHRSIPIYHVPTYHVTDELSCPQNFLLLESTSYKKKKTNRNN